MRKMFFLLGFLVSEAVVVSLYSTPTYPKYLAPPQTSEVLPDMPDDVDTWRFAVERWFLKNYAGNTPVVIIRTYNPDTGKVDTVSIRAIGHCEAECGPLLL